ncbi:interleukin-12 subunit beta-like [Ranitomeya variabilis]|uniref:interleukin-12 subunit beta-like n=1 Tax=Ranitomeya variabilis TaxID=490064 RepID=UPI004057095B
MSLYLSLAILALRIHHLQSILVSWPQNYYAVKEKAMHVLECPLEAQEMNWSFPRHKCNDSVPQKTLHLRPLRHRCTGLYTCTNGAQTYSQYLLIDGGHNPLSFSCSVDSHTSHVLHCSLAENLKKESLVRAKSNNSKMDQGWKEMRISQEGNQLFVFDIPLRGFCPFEEQVHPFNVYVELMSDGEYRTGHMSIYIRDIVVPRSPENLSVTNEKIIWSNPSWTHHPSFFPLLFELSVNYRNNTNVIKTTEEQSYNEKDVRNFTVRCRDLYNPLVWSSWAPMLKIL